MWDSKKLLLVCHTSANPRQLIVFGGEKPTLRWLVFLFWVLLGMGNDCNMGGN